MEAPADTQPQMDAPIELQQAIDTSAEIPPTNPPMEIQKPMEAPTASPHIKDSLEETTKTIDALANSSEPINGPQQMLVVAAKANQEQTTRILPEQASSSSTSALEVKSNDQDIESDALDQQDKKAVWSSKLSGWRFWAINRTWYILVPDRDNHCQHISSIHHEWSRWISICLLDSYILLGDVYWISGYYL